MLNNKGSNVILCVLSLARSIIYAELICIRT